MNIKKKIEDAVNPEPPKPKLDVKAIPLYVELQSFQTYRYYSETLTVPEARRLLGALAQAIDDAVRLGTESLEAAKKTVCCH